MIGAPLGPMAVIAGAGSGKSETMAARLVWLVANGLVRPERVLGLTFTRKAAAELGRPGARPAGRAAPGRARLAGATADDDEAWQGDPVIATYHAYAGRLVADHALREALEPSLRLITPGGRLAARGAGGGRATTARWTRSAGPRPRSPRRSSTCPASWPSTCAARPTWSRWGSGWPRGPRHCRCPGPGGCRRRCGRSCECQRVREQLLPLVAAYAAAKAAREVMDYGDQMALAARIADRASRGRRGRAGPVPGGAAGRVPGHQPCPAGAAARPVRRRAPGDRGRRPVPVDLRLARRERGQPAPVRRGLPGPRRRARPDRGCCPPASATPAGCWTRPPRSRRSCARRRPEVPRLVAAAGRAGRGAVVCALLRPPPTEADWVADQVAELLALPPGVAPDGAAWPDGRGATGGPAVRHRRAVPQAGPVPRAARRAGGQGHPGRGGRSRRPADRARGARTSWPRCG